MRIRNGAIALLMCVASICTAEAQFYKLHNADLGVNVTAPMSSSLTSNGPAIYKTDNSAGLLVSLREHPVPWAGIELNAGYTTFGQQYTLTQQIGLNTVTNVYSLHTAQWETTAGWVLHPHLPWVQPFVVVGGGAVDFVLSHHAGPNQWRGAGMYEVGFDLTSKRMQHGGLRIQQHATIYRAPAYNQAQLANGNWVHQSNPSIGLFWRW